MKRFEVLMTLRAMNFLQQCRKPDRERIEQKIALLETGYYALSEFEETDANGRLNDVTIVQQYSIHYWIDSADEHVKVLDIKYADR
jgi:hypothetical protein